MLSRCGSILPRLITDKKPRNIIVQGVIPRNKTVTWSGLNEISIITDLAKSQTSELMIGIEIKMITLN